MVPRDLNIGGTRVWWLDSGPNLQEWDVFGSFLCGSLVASSLKQTHCEHGPHDDLADEVKFCWTK